MLPPYIDRNALRDSILATVNDADFDPFEGDQQVVKDPLIGGKTYGVIQPHRNSHRGALAHRKVLARIRVSKNYRGLVEDVWNYFAVVDQSANSSGDWATAWVTPDRPLVLRQLSRRTHQTQHPHAKAQWQNQSAAVPWATCDALTCCCEGPKCNELAFF